VKAHVHPPTPSQVHAVRTVDISTVKVHSENGMGMSRIVPNVLSAAARPIGAVEFAAALSKTLGISQVHRNGQPAAIGINKFYSYLPTYLPTYNYS
jgi:hypothetical protein